MKDYYYILGVNKNDSVEHIKKAYRKLSHKFHPDKNDGDDFFADRFKEINEAYEILCDSEKRANYDRVKEKETTNKPDDNKRKEEATKDFGILIPFRKGTKWGFCTIEKTIIVDCIYDSVSLFKEGLAAVEKNGKWGYIGETGIEIIPCSYSSATSFNEGIARVRDYTNFQKFLLKYYSVFKKLNLDSIVYKEKDEIEYKFIDKSGNEVIKRNHVDSNKFADGLAAVQVNGRYGFIDMNGKEVIPFKFYKADNFSEGLAAVTIFNSPKSAETTAMFIDKKGDVVLKTKYDEVSSFREGLALVRITGNSATGKSGFINKSGQEVIGCIYDSAYSFSEGLACVGLEGMNFGRHGKWGFVDKTGKVVIPLKFDSAQSFFEGLAHVGIAERMSGSVKWGFVDKTGKTVIPFKYDFSLSFFKNGLARVRLKRGDGYINGYINKQGVEYWED